MGLVKGPAVLEGRLEVWPVRLARKSECQPVQSRRTPERTAGFAPAQRPAPRANLAARAAHGWLFVSYQTHVGYDGRVRTPGPVFDSFLRDRTLQLPSHGSPIGLPLT